MRRLVVFTLLAAGCGDRSEAILWPPEVSEAGSAVLGVRRSPQVFVGADLPIVFEPEDGAGPVELALFAGDLDALGLQAGFRRLTMVETGTELPEPTDVFVLEAEGDWSRDDTLESAITLLRGQLTNGWCGFEVGAPLALPIPTNSQLASAQGTLLMMRTDQRALFRFVLAEDERSAVFEPLVAPDGQQKGELLGGGSGRFWTRGARSSSVAGFLFELTVVGTTPVETSRGLAPAGVYDVVQVDDTLWAVTELSAVFRQSAGSDVWETVGQASVGDPRFIVTSEGLYLATSEDVFLVQEELQLVYSSPQMITSAIAHPMGGVIVAESAVGETVRVTHVRSAQGEVVLDFLPNLRGTASMLAFEEGLLHEFYSTSGPQLQLRARRYAEAADDCEFRAISSVQAVPKGLYRWGERAVSIRQSQVTGDLFGVVIDQGS